VHTVVAKGEKRGHAHLPLGYHQEHAKHAIVDEGPYGLALSNEIAAPVLASPQLGHNLALASHGAELYLPDPRVTYRMAKLGKTKRARVKATRRA